MDEVLEVYKAGELNYNDYKNLALEAKEDIQFIRTEIYNQVTNDTDLNLVNSSSNDALWEMWADIFAYVSWLLHRLWLIYEQRLNTAAAAVIPHTAYWYSVKAKEFQLGDALTVVDGAIIYPIIDESKRIVAVSAVKENDGKLVLKVAKASASGLEPLDASELSAFDGYIKSIKDAGVSILIVSQNADVLKLELSIYYNPIIPLATIQNNVESAINNYLLNLPFDGIFRRTKLVDALQKIEGVVDINIDVCEASVSYVTTSAFNPVETFYDTVAGYMNIDSNFPLNGSINYISNV